MNFNTLIQTDPEFAQRMDSFMNHEVKTEKEASLDAKTQYISIISALIGCQSIDVFYEEVKFTLENHILTPVEIKEIVYQATAYLGIGKTKAFLDKTNEIMNELHISLPLPSQETTTLENRIEKGEQIQVEIFGDNMIGFSKGNHINRWLSGNCFGDYYTRTGFSLAEREIITFCLLASQGGCDTQLLGHSIANMNLGTDSSLLMKIVSHILPYIGYPRSLNAINTINKAIEVK